MNIICKECGKEFDFSSKEQNFYTSMNYEMPKRCPECRKARKAAKKEAEAQKKWEEAERKLSFVTYGAGRRKRMVSGFATVRERRQG